MSREHYTHDHIDSTTDFVGTTSVDGLYFVTNQSSDHIIFGDLEAAWHNSSERFGDVILHESTESLQRERAYEGASIFTSYDIANEVDFLSRMKDRPYELRRLYLESNIEGFVSEFAGKVPHKTLTGVLTSDGRLEIGGFDMDKMAEETAKMAGPRSREWYEYEGLKRVQELLMDAKLDGHNRVAWVSPSKSRKAKYGMVMCFEIEAYDEALEGCRITERIIRYDEKFGNFNQSRRIFTSLNTLNNQATTPTHDDSRAVLKAGQDFLLNPIAFSGNVEIDDHMLRSIFDYSKEEVEYVHHFEETVQRELGPLINTYVSVALALSEGKYDDPESKYIYLEDLLGAIFNGARIIHEQLTYQREHAGAAKLNSDMIRFGFTTEDTEYREQIAMLRDARPLVLEDGSSCDVAERGASVAEIYLGLSNGRTVLNTLERKNWKYKIGSCKAKEDGGCGRKNVLIGPCHLCKDVCEKRIDEEELRTQALLGTFA